MIRYRIQITKQVVHDKIQEERRILKLKLKIKADVGYMIKLRVYSQRGF